MIAYGLIFVLKVLMMQSISFGKLFLQSTPYFYYNIGENWR